MVVKRFIVYTPNGHEIEVTPETYRKVVKGGKRGFYHSAVLMRLFKNKLEKVENGVDIKE